MPAELTRRQKLRRSLSSEGNDFRADCNDQQDRLCAGDQDWAPRAGPEATTFPIITTALLSRCE
jgi:hypothetical protein